MGSQLLPVLIHDNLNSLSDPSQPSDLSPTMTSVVGLETTALLMEAVAAAPADGVMGGFLDDWGTTFFVSPAPSSWYIVVAQ